jgi:diaminopimelate epimerase
VEGTALQAGRAFYKAHGLGNDYLVFAAEPGGWPVTEALVREICNRWRGPGADGIVVLLETDPEPGEPFPLRMFNPDGSEFERSGNGLRILASYLHRRGLVGHDPFEVRSGGSVIGMQIHAVDRSGIFDVSVEMGRARVDGDAVHIRAGAGVDQGDGIVHRIEGPRGSSIHFVPVSVGNPHAVVFGVEGTEQALRTIGPFLATHAAFGEGTNVQLAEVLGPDRLRIGIWERGVGRTSASGTSSCAAAVAGVARGQLRPGAITVEMEGGELRVTVSPRLDVELRGPVQEVFEGLLAVTFVLAITS